MDPFIYITSALSGGAQQLFGRANALLGPAVDTPLRQLRVCSTHFESGKKEGKDAVPTIFTWTEKTATRPPPKQRGDPVVKTSKFCSIGISVHIHPENHVNTCTIDLISSY